MLVARLLLVAALACACACAGAARGAPIKLNGKVKLAAAAVNGDDAAEVAAHVGELCEVDVADFAPGPVYKQRALRDALCRAGVKRAQFRGFARPLGSAQPTARLDEGDRALCAVAPNAAAVGERRAGAAPLQFAQPLFGGSLVIVLRRKVTHVFVRLTGVVDGDTVWFELVRNGIVVATLDVAASTASGVYAVSAAAPGGAFNELRVRAVAANDPHVCVTDVGVPCADVPAFDDDDDDNDDDVTGADDDGVDDDDDDCGDDDDDYGSAQSEGGDYGDADADRKRRRKRGVADGAAARGGGAHKRTRERAAARQGPSSISVHVAPGARLDAAAPSPLGPLCVMDVGDVLDQGFAVGQLPQRLARDRLVKSLEFNGAVGTVAEGIDATLDLGDSAFCSVSDDTGGVVTSLGDDSAGGSLVPPGHSWYYSQPGSELIIDLHREVSALVVELAGEESATIGGVFSASLGGEQRSKGELALGGNRAVFTITTPNHAVFDQVRIMTPEFGGESITPACISAVAAACDELGILDAGD